MCDYWLHGLVNEGNESSCFLLVNGILLAICFPQSIVLHGNHQENQHEIETKHAKESPGKDFPPNGTAVRNPRVKRRSVSPSNSALQHRDVLHSLYHGYYSLSTIKKAEFCIGSHTKADEGDIHPRPFSGLAENRCSGGFRFWPKQDPAASGYGFSSILSRYRDCVYHCPDPKDNTPK